MTTEFRIFLGADESGADLPELMAMMEKHLLLGYKPYRHAMLMKEAIEPAAINGSRVKLIGGLCRICLPEAGVYFLSNGAESLIYNLPECRRCHGDTGSSEAAIRQRKKEILLGLGQPYKEDKRIIFIES